jgi:Mg2+/Co2+ transporter CorC
MLQSSPVANFYQRQKLTDPPPTYTKAAFESQALSMVLSANLLFCFVKDPEFIKLLDIARPAVELPTCQRLRHLLSERFKKTNEQLLSG